MRSAALAVLVASLALACGSGKPLLFDPAIARLVVFGGAGESGDLADVWTYGGAP